MKALLISLVVSMAGIAVAETRIIPADLHKHLVCDERVMESAVGLELVPGEVIKDSHNPVMQADQLWENALNNLYPNVHYDEAAHQFHLWYKCVLNDKDIIAKLTPERTIHEQGWL